jgi:hypothetical protein
MASLASRSLPRSSDQKTLFYENVRLRGAEEPEDREGRLPWCQHEALPLFSFRTGKHVSLQTMNEYSV